MKKDVDGRVFDFINVIILIIFTILIIVPLWNVLISSFASGQALARGNFIFWPDELSLENYKAVFRDSSMI